MIKFYELIFDGNRFYIKLDSDCKQVYITTDKIDTSLDLKLLAFKLFKEIKSLCEDFSSLSEISFCLSSDRILVFDKRFQLIDTLFPSSSGEEEDFIHFSKENKVYSFSFYKILFLKSVFFNYLIPESASVEFNRLKEIELKL